MSGGTIGPGDVTRLCRSLDFLRRSIENQTTAIKDQSMVVASLRKTILDNQVHDFYTMMGEGGAKEGPESTGSDKTEGVLGGGAPVGASSLGEGPETEGGAETK